MLDRTIFERVIGDDREPAARVKQPGRLFEKVIEALEFVVNRDPQGLKSPGCRMDAGARTPTAHRTFDEDAQFRSARYGCAAACQHDSPRDPARGMLFAEIANNPGEFILALFVQQI